MARLWPEAKVTATDLIPPKPDGDVLPNLRFLKSNADGEWPFDVGEFDFIHGRMLTSGIHDWPGFLAKCYRHLAPNGSLELLDVCHPFRAATPEFDSPDASPFIAFGCLAEKSWSRSGLDYFTTEKHTARLQELGFGQISEAALRWPLGEWGTGDNECEIGRLSLTNFTHFLNAAGKSILTNQGFMAEAEAEGIVHAAMQDLLQNCLQKRFFLTM